MVTIEINCNDDTLTIDGIEIGIKRISPNQLSEILDALLTLLDEKRVRDMPLTIELLMVNEDKRIAVNEWMI